MNKGSLARSEGIRMEEIPQGPGTGASGEDTGMERERLNTVCWMESGDQHIKRERLAQGRRKRKGNIIQECRKRRSKRMISLPASIDESSGFRGQLELGV